jgi:hypothetical protein
VIFYGQLERKRDVVYVCCRKIDAMNKTTASGTTKLLKRFEKICVFTY